MPSANHWEDLYDFENTFEEPIAAMIRTTDIGNSVYTRLNAAQLQRDSERVEIVMRVGEATRHEGIIDKNTSTCRWDTWKANFTFTIVTSTKANDNKHGAWRAIVRNISAQLVDTL